MAEPINPANNRANIVFCDQILAFGMLEESTFSFAYFLLLRGVTFY